MARVHGLFDAQLFLDLLQRHALRLRNQRLHPDELQNHHAGEERENVTRRKGGDHLREESRKQGGEDPVREAAEGLTFRAMTVGKYLGDENPEDRSRANGGPDDEGKEANGYDREMLV